MGGFSFALSLLVRRLRPRWPALLLGLLGGATLVWALPGTFASVAHVQALSSALPGWNPLVFDSRSILDLLPAAVACGMLGLVTSLSIARALAARQGDAFDANQEVRAQGLSNLLGPWLSASLSAGSFTRSGLNLEAGARSPLAGAFSALWVVLLAVLGARLIEHVPLPAMAAGILLIAWGLIDRPALRALYRSGRAECLVAGLTALATLLLPLQNAIYAGVLASLFFYLRRTSTPRVLRQRNDEEEVLRIEGSIFFGACDYLQRLMRQCDRPRLVLDARQVNFIDFAGAVLLQQEARRLHAEDAAWYCATLARRSAKRWAGRPTKAAACTTKADAQGAAGDVGALSPGSSCGDSRCSLSRIISNCPRAARASSISSALRSPPCSAASIRARISGICCTPLV